VLPYLLEQRALRRLRPGVVGVLLTTEPAIAGLAGMVVIGEHLSAPRWLGIACISVAAATAVRAALRRAEGCAPS
jgi:inner membrane transporter RhtA